MEVRGFLRFFGVDRIHTVRGPVRVVEAVLRALLVPHADRSDRHGYLRLCDPPAAALARSAGVGARLSLSLGHHFSKSDRMRFVCEGVIERLSDGAYHMRDQDLHVRMGPTAIIITDPMYNSP